MPEWDNKIVPLEPGYAIQPNSAAPRNGQGSIGGFIYSPKTRTYYLLSNAHVLASNPFDANSAFRLYQPSSSGGNLISDGILYEPIRRPPAVNRLDVGIARLGERLGLFARYEFGHGKGRVQGIEGIRDPVRGEPLTLCSHRWPQTSNVGEIDVDADIPYPDTDDKNVYIPFSGLVELTTSASAPHPVSIKGASGAFYVSPKDRCVVLFAFSGGDSANHGYGFPIRRVLEWVEKRLDDSNAGIVSPDGRVFSRNGFSLMIPPP